MNRPSRGRPARAASFGASPICTRGSLRGACSRDRLANRLLERGDVSIVPILVIRSDGPDGRESPRILPSHVPRVGLEVNRDALSYLGRAARPTVLLKGWD